jgi:hypothetical protein
LSIAEVRLIKGMLALVPPPAFQEVLAYFTWPGREINHRVISEIAGGHRWSSEPAAGVREVLDFMAAVRSVPRPNPAHFTGNSGGGVVASMRHGADLSLEWWPVGQGLFASGSLRLNRRQTFVWVYDCGSSTGGGVLDEALDACTDSLRLRGASRLGLVTLSHFDHDHISGIVRLIKRFPVRRLLLPYVPLSQRLLIAAGEGVAADDPLMTFFIDPVAYLSGVEGAEIEEIVLVPAAGPDDFVPPAPETPGIRPEDGGEEGALDGEPADLEGDYGPPPPEAAGDPAAVGQGPPVRFLKPGGRLVIPGLWEFIPYNDADLLPKADARFLSRVNGVSRLFVASPPRRAKALQTLKKIYRHHFGRGSGPQNLLSLFLYSGPIDGRAELWARHSNVAGLVSRRSCEFSQLHTGDGYLDTSDRLDRLRRFYSGGGRLRRARILQVMHHGAQGNWHAGVATVLRPEVSIFSSDPAHRWGHPSAEVLREFWTFGAVQVDGLNGFYLQGCVRLP